MSELFKGVATMTQSDEYFDCYPAISSAFKYAKLFSKEGVADEDVLVEDCKGDGTAKAKVEVELELEFGELQLFFWFLKQYFVLCEVKSILLVFICLGKSQKRGFL